MLCYQSWKCVWKWYFWKDCHFSWGHWVDSHSLSCDLVERSLWSPDPCWSTFGSVCVFFLGGESTMGPLCYENVTQASVPITVFRWNLKFDKNLECSSLKLAPLIPTKFCTCDKELRCRDVWKTSLWSVKYILSQSMANFSQISNLIEILLVEQAPGVHYTYKNLVGCLATWPLNLCPV